MAKGEGEMKEFFLLKMKVIADTGGHKVVILGKGSDAAGGVRCSKGALNSYVLIRPIAG